LINSLGLYYSQSIINCGVRFAEMYHSSPSLPFNPLSYLVRFGDEAEHFFDLKSALINGYL
jgi:hypothetical protein